MTFDEWFDESEHDFFNYPDECMRDSWNKATQEKDKEIAELKAETSEQLETIVKQANIVLQCNRDNKELKANSIPIEKLEKLVESYPNMSSFRVLEGLIGEHKQ